MHHVASEGYANHRILCVDDEESVVEALRRNLSDRYVVDTALSAAAALELLKRGHTYAVVVTDMRMPEMNGARLLELIREQFPTTTRMLLTGFSEIEAAIEAVNKGQLFRFLTKPCPPDDLVAAVRAGVEQHRLLTAEKELLERTLNGCVQMLTELMAAAQPGVPNSALAARKLAHRLGCMVGLSNTWHIELGAVVAQLARVTMPDHVIEHLDPGANLEQKQREVIRRCLQLGERLLSSIPRLERVRELLLAAYGLDDQPSLDSAGYRESSLLRMILDYQTLLESYGNSWGVLKFMRSQPTLYDPELLSALEQYCAPHPNRLVMQLPLDSLQPGMELASDATDRVSHAVLMHKGTELTLPVLERLKGYGAAIGVNEPISVYPVPRSTPEAKH